MSSELDKIANASQIKIDQRIEWIECVPCCENKNEYTIYNTDEQFVEQGEEIGKVGEEDPGIPCLFFCKCFRKYENNLYINNYQVAKSERPYKCALPHICNCFTALECCQDEVIVKIKDEKIGSIKWPMACFLYPGRGLLSCCELDVKDEKDEIIYKITANFTQLPFIVQAFCGASMGCIKPLSRKEYSIMDTNGNVVGSITNIYNDLLYECCTRADNFAVKFPSGIDVNKKLLLLKAAVFLDYIQYMA